MILRPTLKATSIVLAISLLLQLARAQEVAGYLGLGGTFDSSNGAQIDTFGDGVLHKTPSLGGVFTQFGASVFIAKHLGVGGEIFWKSLQGDYAGIPYRPTFYNFDAIFRPATDKTKRFEPDFRAGIGGAHLNFFSVGQPSCAQVPACPSSNHFQAHLGAAARWYFTDHFFLRPGLDVHYVNGLSEFGSNWMPQYSLSIGYSLGRGE